MESFKKILHLSSRMSIIQIVAYYAEQKECLTPVLVIEETGRDNEFMFINNCVNNVLHYSSIANEVATATAGETVTLTVYPASGYELSAIRVHKTGDASVTVSVNGFNGFNGLNGTFTIPDLAHLFLDKNWDIIVQKLTVVNSFPGTHIFSAKRKGCRITFRAAFLRFQLSTFNFQLLIANCQLPTCFAQMRFRFIRRAWANSVRAVAWSPS